MLVFRFRSKPYLDFIRSRPCLRRHLHGTEDRPAWTPFYLWIDPDHYVSTKWKDGSDGCALPLCRWCHTERHGMAKDVFYEKLYVESEIERLHVEFLKLVSLTQWPDETFEACLERNGLGTHEKNGRTALGNFTKRFVPLHLRKDL